MRKSESSTNQGFKFGLGLRLVLVAALIIVVMMGLPTCLSRCGNVARKRVAPPKAAIDIKQIGRALNMYKDDNGTYPTTEQGLDALIRKPFSQPEPMNWLESYVEPTNFRDPWGAGYIYRCPSQHEGYDYDLYSYGTDGMDGGGDDIVKETEDIKVSGKR